MEIPFQLVGFPYGRILTIHATLNFAPNNKSNTSGSMIRAGAIIFDASAKFREYQHHHFEYSTMFFQVIIKITNCPGYLLP